MVRTELTVLDLVAECREGSLSAHVRLGIFRQVAQPLMPIVT